jgi:hypothetical protein
MRPRARTAFVALVSGLACNGGLDPLATPTTCPPGQVEICGTITFRGTVPDSTQAVYVVAYHTFPRSRDSLFNFQPPLLELQRLPLDRTSAFYAIPVTTGRYEWIAAVWVKQGFTLANADTTLRETGYYRDPADSTQPGVVMVTAQGADSIDFVVDFAQMHAPCSYYAPPCP